MSHLGRWLERELAAGLRDAARWRRARQEFEAKVFAKRDDPTYPPRYYVPGSIGVGNFPLHVESDMTTPKAKAEAQAAEVLDWTDDELAYLYVLLHEGRGLRFDSCVHRLRKVGWR